MSKGSLLCSLVLVQVCIVQLCLISSCQLTGGQAAGGEVLCQDPIGRPRLMSRHGRDELGSHSADSIFDEEELADEEGLSAVDEYASDGVGLPAEEEERWLPDDDGGGGGRAKGSGSGSGRDVECPECGKFFKNDKSMFGHLRSHPNRGYKGATPPVMNKPKPSPETMADPSPSPSSPSPGTHQPRPRRDRRLSPFEIACTYEMLTLQYPENSQSAQQAPPATAPAPPSFCKSETNVLVIEQGVGTSITAAAAEAHADEYGGSISKIPKKRRNVLKQIREEHRKKAKLVALPPPKEKGPYICKHCKAEFSTHQALGGHMAGHHRDRKVLTLNEAASSRVHQGMAAQSHDRKLQVKGGGDDHDGWRDSGLSLRRGLSEHEQLSMASNVPRQSGQASGGQMIEMRQQHPGRRSDGLTLAAPAPAPAPTPTQADDRGGRRLLNIDLNAEATEQE